MLFTKFILGAFLSVYFKDAYLCCMIDLKEYGFKLLRDDDGYFVYTLTNGVYIVELHVADKSYSIDVINQHGDRINVAQRYTCHTKEQVEFLLFNSSRVGWIINPELTDF